MGTWDNGNKLKYRKFHLSRKKNYYNSDSTGAAQGSCEVSFSGDTQNLDAILCNQVQESSPEASLNTNHAVIDSVILSD